MEANKKHSNSSSNFKSRWRHSINQFSKLEQQSKLFVLDTVHRNSSLMKLKMINRLGQIDQSWNPIPIKRNIVVQQNQSKQKCKIASTTNGTNILTLQSYSSNPKLQQSLIIYSDQPNPQQNDPKISYTCHQIREQIIQELTEYNRSRYANEMKQQCSKYSGSMKSMFYSLVNHQKKQLYQFCYMCDEVMEDTKLQKKINHCCKNQIDSISKVHQALLKLKILVYQQNNKIFHIFLHNALQANISIEELITNVTVLKQSIELKYQPEDAVLRMRLMNLIGKKIGLLIEEKDLEDRLKSLCKSKK